MEFQVPTMQASQRWIDWLGLEVELRGDGLMIARLDQPRVEHFDGDGAINAAVSYAVAEIAGTGAAVYPVSDLIDHMTSVVTQARIEYDHPSHDGLIATAMLNPGAAARERATLLDGHDVIIDVNVLMNDLNGLPVGRAGFSVSLRHRRHID